MIAPRLLVTDVASAPRDTVGPSFATVRELRRTRQRRRLGDIEWFDVAYRAYIYGFGGLAAVVVLSDTLGSLIGDDVDTALVLDRGPSVLGLIVAAALALGLRGGAHGGPLSIEVADIAHLLLAPVDRRRVLLRPAMQRLRSAVFGAVVIGAVVGQLVGREVDGSRGSWAAAGALFGAAVAAVFVSAAILAHAARLPGWAATAIGIIVVAWQAVVAWSTWRGSASPPARLGPTNLEGSLGFWGIRQRPIDVIALVAIAMMIVVAGLVVGRLRIEALVRRARLVSQLRFAATMQDLRTVVLLRRQLRSESLRSRPWGARAATTAGVRVAAAPVIHVPRRTAVPTWSAATVWRRGVQSLRRLPPSRVGRIAALAVIGGSCAALAVAQTPLFAIGLLGALLLVALESLEPLSQEIDHPDRTDALPIARGVVFAHSLVAPALLLVVVAIVGAATATLVEPSTMAFSFALAVPVVLGGAIGAVVTTVRDAPPLVAPGDVPSAPADSGNPLLPPEFAGFHLVVNALLPVVLTAIGTLPVVAMYFEPTAATAARTAVGVLLAVIVTVLWVVRRDRWGASVRAFVAEGKAAQRR